MTWVLFLLSAPVLTKGQMIPEDQTKAETYAYQSKENPGTGRTGNLLMGTGSRMLTIPSTPGLDDQTDIVDGHLILTYTNNSPDGCLLSISIYTRKHFSPVHTLIS